MDTLQAGMTGITPTTSSILFILLYFCAHSNTPTFSPFTPIVAGETMEQDGLTPFLIPLMKIGLKPPCKLDIAQISISALSKHHLLIS
jgi:hypothetical protein